MRKPKPRAGLKSKKKKTPKQVLWGAGAVVIALLLLAALMFVVVDINDYKPRLQAAAARATGMQVQLKGAVNVRFFPGIYLILNDVEVQNRGIKVGSAQQVRLGIYFFPLLTKKVQVKTVSLQKAKLNVERDREGILNTQNTDKPKGTPRTADLVSIVAPDASMRYLDQQTGQSFEAKECKLEASRLRLSGVVGDALMQNVQVTADMACAHIGVDEVKIENFQASVQGEKGKFEIKPLRFQVFGGQGSGELSADVSVEPPRWQTQVQLRKFQVEQVVAAVKPTQVVQGAMDFSMQLSLQGKTLKALRQTTHGQASLHGQDLLLVGRDLDQELARYASTQNFNLVDMGALYFAGPLGLAITKGHDYANLLRGKGGSSQIRRLVSEWKIEHGVAEAQDVAITTNESRLALRGGLDFANQRYQHITVALVDAKGCTLVRQKINGPFDKPAVEKPNVIKAIAGPALKLLTKSKEIFRGKQCELFYSGSVPATDN